MTRFETIYRCLIWLCLVPQPEVGGVDARYNRAELPRLFLPRLLHRSQRRFRSRLQKAKRRQRAGERRRGQVYPPEVCRLHQIQKTKKRRRAARHVKD